MRLEELLPQFDQREQHSLHFDTSPERALAAAREVTWSDARAFRFLMFVRLSGAVRLEPEHPILEDLIVGGYSILSQVSDEIVIGSVMQAQRPGGPVELPGDKDVAFAEFGEPGHIKIAFNFRYSKGLLTTETRVLATDEKSRTTFRPYWSLIRLPSGVVRREWLRAIRSRALRSH